MNKRLIVWNHFIEQWAVEKRGGGNGVTGKRLRQIKGRVMEDDRLWFDIIDRHGVGSYASLETMRTVALDVYEHCQSNFWGMVVALMGRQGLIRRE